MAVIGSGVAVRDSKHLGGGTVVVPPARLGRLHRRPARRRARRLTSTRFPEPRAGPSAS
ncbi:MAG: hypothetical protein ABR608_00180 [Pseudonocardiaceae bacterium]